MKRVPSEWRRSGRLLPFVRSGPDRTPQPRRTAVCGWLCLLAVAGCSHTTPYYRSDVPWPVELSAPDRGVKDRILLVGDAGDTYVSAETLVTVRRWASRMPEKTLILFLGDNIYRAGMPEPTDPKRPDAERCLLAQLAVVEESGARGVFLSGNHDWADDKKGGLAAVKRQEAFVNARLRGDGNFLPKGGSAGPVKIDLDGVRIIVLNTAWWLHEEGADGCEDPAAAKDAVIEGLKGLLSSAAGRVVIVAAHHPVASHGTQGGFYDWKDHLFPSVHLARWLWIPTPGLGSLYPLLRGHVCNKQTLAGPGYRQMIKRLTEALSTNRPLIYAAGHDHGLQVLEGAEAAEYILVSALGPDAGAAMSHGDDTLFAYLHPGFMAVDVMEDGAVLLRVIESDRDQVVLALWLRTAQ